MDERNMLTLHVDPMTHIKSISALLLLYFFITSTETEALSQDKIKLPEYVTTYCLFLIL